MTTPNETPVTDRPSYEAALRSRGLEPADAKVVADATFALSDVRAPNEPLVSWLVARLPEAALRLLLDVVIEAQARGPQHPERAVAWRRLYVAGCPMDNVDRILWHSFHDPKADIQDWTWVPPERAMAELERYVRLEFPRTGSMRYGPGLGCERLWTNTLHGHREIMRIGAPFVFVGQSLNLARNVMSLRLRERVDRETGLKPVLIVDTIDRLPWQTELLDLDAVDGDVQVRWFDVVEAMFERGEILHDLSGDRFIVNDEALTERTIQPRLDPPPPRPRPTKELSTLLEAWHATSEPWMRPVATDDLDLQDPAAWLASVAELVRE